jgi:hypothetical protein
VAVGIGTAANPTGTTIALTSNNPGVTVPATVMVPAGRPGVRVPVSVAASASLGGTARITATWNGTSVTNTVSIGRTTRTVAGTRPGPGRRARPQPFGFGTLLSKTVRVRAASGAVRAVSGRP